MAIDIKNRKQNNKFDQEKVALDEQENVEKEKTKKVIQSIAGDVGDVKIVKDKNGRIRRLKIKEPRKAFQVYLPLSVFEQLESVLEKSGKSRNSIIEELVREYIEKQH